MRLTQGDFARETVYGDDPVGVARRWEALGARWIHVVDLDGARAGRPVQAPLVAAICAAVRIPVQVGGGMRDAAAIETALEGGVARVVLGTIAVREPARGAALCRAFPGRVAIGIDARDGDGTGRRVARGRSRRRAGAGRDRGGVGRGGDRLHRHRSRRDAGGTGPRGDARRRAGSRHPGRRLGRGRDARARACGRRAGRRRGDRRHRRPRALLGRRRPARRAGRGGGGAR